MAQVSRELFSREESAGQWRLCPEHRAAAPRGPQQHHFTGRHATAAKFSGCVAMSVIPVPVEAGVFLIKCLKPGGTPAARVAQRELSAQSGSLLRPLPPQHRALADTSCSTTGVLQEIPSHTFLIFCNRAAISATHPERIFNEKRGERACTFPAHKRAEALWVRFSLFLAAHSCSRV